MDRAQGGRGAQHVGALIWTLGVWIAWSIAVQRGIPDAFVETFER